MGSLAVSWVRNRLVMYISFKTVTNKCRGCGSDLGIDVFQNPHLAEVVRDIPRGFAENRIFDSELSEVIAGRHDVTISVLVTHSIVYKPFLTRLSYCLISLILSGFISRDWYWEF